MHPNIIEIGPFVIHWYGLLLSLSFLLGIFLSMYRAEKRGVNKDLVIDVAIVVDHLTLAATDMGLGTCWIASFNKEPARRHLELPETHEPIVFTPLGYPAGQPRPKERKPLEELVVYK